MDNSIEIPYINPVKFVKQNQTNLAKYFTKHFEDYLFKDRLYDWQQREDTTRIWQTDDIISLQFESTFDPIIVELINGKGRVFITLPALIGLPNKFDATLFSFEVQMSLAGLTTGCYWLRVTAGSGVSTTIFISGKQYISAEPIRNSIVIEYSHHRFHEGVMFETGVKFQARFPGHFGPLIPGVQNQLYKDEKYNPTILSSRTFRQWYLYFCDEFGGTDDDIDLLNRIWTCSSIAVDGKLFGCVDGKMEFVEIPGYPKRGIKMLVEEGLNRSSKVTAVGVDTNKQLASVIIVDAKVFEDLANAGSTNAVPVYNIE